jgi:hypothetical protein
LADSCLTAFGGLRSIANIRRAFRSVGLNKRSRSIPTDSKNSIRHFSSFDGPGELKSRERQSRRQVEMRTVASATVSSALREEIEMSTRQQPQTVPFYT